MWNCHSWPLDVSSNVSTRGLDLPADLGVDLPNLNSSSPHVRCQYQGCCQIWCQQCDLGVDLMTNLNSSSPQDVSTPGGRSASWSVNINSHSRNVNLLFLTTRSAGRFAIWTLTSMGTKNLLVICQYEIHELLNMSLKSVIVIWRCFVDVDQGCQGCYIWHHSTLLTDCLLP